ncbi:MAG: DNA-directed RNA polymerase subunit beta', partial [Mailhella sp.]|nr:DNA-directed RNA polymerase subunit beta' [Mailhella sp.]
GKQGRFRQNLLGKRVDYSGRSVICVGPTLKLHQCGLPKKMALELFKPFIYSELEKRGFATTIKSAKRMVEREEVVVWDILADIVREYPILLNRAPTLHRLGIQAFEPLLVEGKAIRLHPLVCTAFNADFDGDQMAVHIPLSVEAQVECRVLLMSTNNILSPANGKPIIIPSQDMVLGLYYMTVDRSFCKGEGMTFCAPWEVEAAYDAGRLDLHARIRVRMDACDGTGAQQVVDTTCGRILVWERLPHVVPFSEVNKIFTKSEIGKLVGIVYKSAGIKNTVLLCDQLKNIGYEFSTRAGISIGLKDMTIPSRKAEILEKAQAQVDEVVKQHSEGVITDSERYNILVDVWQKTSDDISEEMMKEISTEVVTNDKGETAVDTSLNPIYMMSTSGARGNKDQMRQLGGMRGLMSKPSGEIIETPITANFREGLTVLQYFTSTHGARKGLADTALKTANSGYLTRRLVDVVQDVIVSEHDCRTADGIEMGALIEDGEVKVKLRDRIMGRVFLYPVADPVSKKELFPANTLVDEKVADALDAAGVNTVTIRSALTCHAERGVCALCYGRDLARGHLVNVGETVGIVAAQSIGEPGTQLTMRTFHIGGTASSKAEQKEYVAKNPGVIALERVKSVINREGKTIVVGKTGQVAIKDELLHDIEKYKLPNGAALLVQDGQKVDRDTLLAEWDPYNEPVVAEVSGFIRFKNINDKTVQQKLDETIGTSTQEVIAPGAVLEIVDEQGEVVRRSASGSDLASYALPIKAIIMARDKEAVQAGDVIARRARETSKTKDITSGLPRVAELFEARKPKELAIVSEISGTVEHGPETKGKRKVLVRPDAGDVKEYLIPRSKHIVIPDGEYVEAGEPLTEGLPELRDILHTRGEKYLASYIVDEIQKVYRTQGVGIDDKHIEVIVRQMLKKVTIVDPGQTTFLMGEQVDKSEFKEENEKAVAEGRAPAVAEPLVLGITQASLSSLSWVAAASFQETTKVLTEASLRGKQDYLRGLKENVIVGRLIPAGTGYRQYVNQGIEVPDQKERPDKFLEDLVEHPIIAKDLAVGIANE